MSCGRIQLRDLHVPRTKRPAKVPDRVRAADGASHVVRQACIQILQVRQPNIISVTSG